MKQFSADFLATISFAVVFSLSIASLTMLASSLLVPQLKTANVSVLTVSSLNYQSLIPESLERKSLKLSSFKLLASQIYSAAFNDVSPGFDDLYIIKTQDKGREIIIYCNTNYCYKNRNVLMTS